jgi:tripartite-type tricarboxylate transporter receptor subunit TctC
VQPRTAIRSSSWGHQLRLMLYDKLNFNVIRDIAPVASIARAPNVLEVSLSVPVKTVPEFIAYAKALLSG